MAVHSARPYEKEGISSDDEARSWCASGGRKSAAVEEGVAPVEEGEEVAGAEQGGVISCSAGSGGGYEMCLRGGGSVMNHGAKKSKGTAKRSRGTPERS